MSPLVRKLRLQQGQRALILNAPEGYVEGLGELPEGVIVTQESAGETFDFVHLFAKNSAEFAAFGPAAQQAVRYDGVLWISYPKGSAKVETDLSRDAMWGLLSDAGMRPVSQISIDDTWSAVRFRPGELVNAKG
ncbi:MAG: hypothetical protein MUF84_04605 [Anaerolineae bacterium]|nr:hypothetical protein [Anaerolineae bacterium]